MVVKNMEFYNFFFFFDFVCVCVCVWGGGGRIVENMELYIFGCGGVDGN